MSQQRDTGGIAIIGIGLRFPGASTVDSFWRNLQNGRESVRFFSDQELLGAGVPEDLLSDPAYVKASPILDGFDLFDESFFGYSPKEAVVMDPQNRLLLEVAWETFEDAGYLPSALQPSCVGVFIGGGSSLTSYLLAFAGLPDLQGQTAGLEHVANDRDFLATRISYKLNLTGPSVTVQTACSTSLVAVHLACQSVLNGESDLALAGASVVRVPHISGYRAVRGSVHSTDGHCRPFDASGTGTIFGSGVATVLLKPLKAALRDGDHIYAVIRASAVTNDGNDKLSYTAASATGQARAVIEALTLADVPADSLSYVECHATGTPAGDPVEIQALTRAFRLHTKANGFCSVGSVKGNIGHAEQAGGMGGLIKTALALHDGTIPPTIGFVKLNPQLGLPETPFRIQTAFAPWPEERRPRRAGVNSLGIGGTNAFLVLEEAPASHVSHNESSAHLFAISAKTATALTMYAERFIRFLQENPGTDLPSLCFTSCVSRTHFEHRFAAVVNSAKELIDALERMPSERTSERPRIVFLFSGQGSQYSGMGLELYKSIPEFRRHFDACDAICEPLIGRSLKEIVFRPDCADLNQTRWTQPALFALEYSIAEVWRAWGVSPTAVMGHSLGEISAACFSGMLSLRDAVEFVTTRAALMQTTSSNGAMEAFLTDRATVEAALTGLEHQVGVAAFNTPTNTVVSGERDALSKVRTRLAKQGIASKSLAVSHAFHSPLMDPILSEIESAASRITALSPQCTLVSNVTGDVISSVLPATYWRDHVRKPVRFADGLNALGPSGTTWFIEIGPGSTLLSLARECLAPSRPPMHASLSAPGDELRKMFNTAAALYVAGVDLRWNALYQERVFSRISLPTYPFERKRHWLTPPPACNHLPDPGLYQVAWKRSPLRTEGFYPGSVVVVANDSNPLRKALAGQCRVISATTQSVRHVLAEHAAYSPQVLYVADSISLTNSTGINEFIAIEEAHTDSALALVQAITDTRSSGNSRLWFITRGAQSIHGASADPLQAALWGMGRSLHLEAPRQWGGLIDISPETCPEECARNILAAMFDSTAQQHLFVDGDHYTPQLVSSCGSHSEPISVKLDRTYLVTGGLGGIGRLTARWLLEEKRAGCVVLVSRHTHGAVPEELMEYNGRVCVIAADIAAERDVLSVLNKISNELPPLAGIFHGAGVLADGIAVQMKPEQFAAATAPKIRGAWLLHRHTAHLPLDFFIVHSSLLSLTGSAGQCNYTAANAFLDALVQYRRARHLPGMAINWGPWAEAGMAMSTGARSEVHWRNVGIRPLRPATGMRVINRLFESPAVNVAVVDCDWAQYGQSVPQNRPVIGRLAAADNPAAAVSRPGLRAEFAAGDSSRRESLVTETVRARVSAELGVAGSIDMNRRLDDLGVDSLMAVNLANSIESTLGVPISVSQVIGSATVQELAASVLKELSSNDRTEPVNGTAAWIVTPVPRPNAQFRLFCFHYAGASASVYRSWADLLSPAIELCAVDPPGRGARLSEPSVTSLGALLDGILPEIQLLLDRPYALMGHCLGALNLFEAGRSLMRSGHPPVHIFVSGCRPPHSLLTHGMFEESLLRTLLSDDGYDPAKPFHKQPDHTFATLIRQFNIGATESFLAHSELRDILLPAIRADFEIASRYRFTPEPAWDVPLTCFIGLDDPYVTREDAVGWNRYTCRDFRIHFRPGNHFLIVEDRDFIISTINTSLAPEYERKPAP